jgi:hypothetical protein
VTLRDSDAKPHDAHEDEDLIESENDQWVNPFYILRMMWNESPEWIIEHLPKVVYYSKHRPTMEYVNFVLGQEQARQPRMI